ncbi:hypothetical protein DSUL_20118 [Desulfovibrionales bacterium]
MDNNVLGIWVLPKAVTTAMAVVIMGMVGVVEVGEHIGKKRCRRDSRRAGLGRAVDYVL